MYTYFNQKYGLKNLIIEHIVSLLNSMKVYENEDHDIKLFLAVLKNQCDEDFRTIQVHVKDTLINLVELVLRERFPMKLELDIKNMLEMVKKGYIEEWILSKVIDKMYD